MPAAQTAKQKPSPAPAPLPEPVPQPIPRICANCQHWRVRHMVPTFGECLKSGSAPAPVVTTDLSKCSAFELRPA